MAPWQVIFQVVPHRTMAKAPRVLDAGIVASTSWWGAGAEARELRDRLTALLGGGNAEGNGVDLHLAGARVERVIARVDVRKLDPKFGAALLGFVRSMQSVLIRTDGWVAEPTVGAFSGALRGDPAWAHANEAGIARVTTEEGADED